MNRARGIQASSRPSGFDALRLRPGDRVLILGGYGVRNVGDEAILSGLLNELPDCRLRVVSRAPRETSDMHNVRATSPAGALGALLSSDVLVVGGGGIFSGHMGTMGKLVPLFSRLALARGARVSFHGIGIYSSAPRHVLRGIVSLVPKLTSLTVRDTASARLLRSWGIDASIVPDLSQGMPPDHSTRGEELLERLGLSPTRPRVALCLTAIEQGLAESLVRSLPSLIDTLPDVQFAFIPMSHHPTIPHHNDLRFAHQLRSRVPQLVILEDRLHPVEVLALLGQFPVIVAMRYHALLFAERVGAAVVPIPYAEKCYSWLEDSGLEPAGTDAGSLTERIRQALSDRRVGVGGGRTR